MLAQNKNRRMPPAPLQQQQSPIVSIEKATKKQDIEQQLIALKSAAYDASIQVNTWNQQLQNLQAEIIKKQEEWAALN